MICERCGRDYWIDHTSACTVAQLADATEKELEAIWKEREDRIYEFIFGPQLRYIK